MTGNFSGNGWTCGVCGCWVIGGEPHSCGGHSTFATTRVDLATLIQVRRLVEEALRLLTEAMGQS
jgi:fluoride ion exporter CrcB/FEX